MRRPSSKKNSPVDDVAIKKDIGLFINDQDNIQDNMLKCWHKILTPLFVLPVRPNLDQFRMKTKKDSNKSINKYKIQSEIDCDRIA